MTNEKEEKEESGLGENLSGVGQLIIGGIETIGGILTGDPTTRAEGDFNQQVGSLHQEMNKNLTAIENNEEVECSETPEYDKSENNE
jgi:hypothetical protein